MKIFLNTTDWNNPKIEITETEICYHCEEPNNNINSSYCCKGCEDAEIKLNQLDSLQNGCNVSYGQYSYKGHTEK